MKYMGSKSRFSKEIYSIISEIIPDIDQRVWVEPFAGGMNMVCNVPQGIGRIANDSNKYLIAMFKALQDGWIPPDFVSKEFYDSCRNFEQPDHVVGYVGFNCSYSGKWFGGYCHSVIRKTGSQKGAYRDYQKEAKTVLTKQIQKLEGVEFVSTDYSKLYIPTKSIIYCDPPYQNTTKYKDNFNTESFWDWAREQSKINPVFISEYSAPSDFMCVWEKSAKSYLSANGKIGGRKNSIEKLFKIK